MSEKKVYDLKINPKFEKVAPPLATTEDQILTDDLRENGCQFPIIVWNGTIVDGHNRYRICHKYGIPFAIEEMEFANERKAIVWIIKNQLGRRNMKLFQRCEMVIPYEEDIKEELEEQRKDKISAYRSGDETVAPGTTVLKSRDILAKMAGVSTSTFRRVKTIVRLADEETKQKLRDEEIGIKPVYNQLIEKENKNSHQREENIHQVVGTETRPPAEEEPAIKIDEPLDFVTPIQREPEEQFTPENFDDVKAQVQVCIRDFMMNFGETMKWIGKQHVTKKNEAAVTSLLKEGYKTAVDTVKERFEELKGE